MRFRRSLLRLVALACAFGFARAADIPAAPKLVVVISIDQMRADYLVRFRPYFVDGGFKRLLEGGTVFEKDDQWFFGGYGAGANLAGV